MAADDGNGIGQAVGVGQPNQPDDVRRVQEMLNRHAATGDTRLAEDGAFGPRTTMRLIEHQRDVVGMSRPDGVADPHGPTMRSLSGAPSAAASHGKAAASDANEHVSDYVASHPVLHPHETAKTKAWIDQALPAARATQEKWGVPASVTLAQGALESAWGTTHPGGEYFGVKGQSPDGRSVSLATHEEKGGKLHGETDSFRSYGSLGESADDYGRFLATNKRYSAAFDHKDDGERFIHEVAKAGYATDSHYESKIRSIIDHHDLTRYDKPQFQNTTQAAPGGGGSGPCSKQDGAQKAAIDGLASEAFPPAAASAKDSKAYWLADARAGREAADAGNIAQAPRQAAGSNPSGSAATDARSWWLAQAQAGHEAAAMAATEQQAPGAAQAAGTQQATMPAIRLRQ